MLNGNVIGKVNATTTASGSGVWSLREQFLAGVGNIWPLNRITDSLWSKTALLLKTNGVNNATNATFVDSSSNNFTVTRNGTPTQGSLSPYVPTGYWGGSFDGTGDYLTTPVSTQFNFDGQFTIEAWVNFSATTGRLNYIFNYLNDSEAGWMLRYNATGSSLRFFTGFSSIDRSWTPVLNSWYHVAVTRDSSNAIRLFVDGQQLGTSATDSGTFSQTQYGVRVGFTDTFGSISNARIVKGSAVYTAAFTPPTAPLIAVSGTSLLCLQDNRFKDNSTNNFAITKYGDTSVTRFSPFQATYETTYGGSAYFGGSDRLTIADSAALNVGTGDFTWECMFNPANTSGVKTLMQKGPSTGAAGGSSSASIMLSGNQIVWGGGTEYTCTQTFTANTWNHIAVTRSGTSLKMWLNGVAGGTFTDSVDYTTTSVVSIGDRYASHPLGQYPYTGLIANTRILKGTAAYTAAFTPPTAPVISVSGTSLLLNFNNAGVYDAARSSNLTMVGDAKVSTTAKKYADASMYFDGTGDYVTVSENYSFDNKVPFTAECWFYPTRVTGTGAYEGILTTRNAGVISPFNLLQDGSSVRWLISTANGAGWTQATGGTLTANTWHHLAISADGTNLKLFLNGTAILSTTHPTYGFGKVPLIVGGNLSEGQYFNGQIEDARLTLGAARYAANFTPPTAALASANPA